MKTSAVKERRPAPATVRRRPHVPLGPVQRTQQARIGRILRSTGAQVRLTIGQPNDRYEQGADRLADQITPLVQRQEEPSEEGKEPLQAKFWYGETVQRLGENNCPECEEEMAQRQPVEGEDEEPLQTKEQSGRTLGVTPNIESRINGMKGGGQPLDSVTRSFFEPRFGRDFSDVRLYTDSTAADTAKSIHARAFTLGKHVVMGSGEYQPTSQSGQRLLGHELTHVVQQAGRQRYQENPKGQITRTPEKNIELTHVMQRRASAKDSMIQKAGLGTVPKSNLRSMDIDTSQISLYAKLDVIFDPKNSALQKFVGSSTIMNTKVLMNNITYVNIPEKLKFGFRNIASSLVGGGTKATLKGQETSGTAPDSGETKSLLLTFTKYPKLKKLWKVAKSSSTSIDKDQFAALAEVSSDRAYRFTTYGSGATQKIMIEGLGKAKVETRAQGLAGKKMVTDYNLIFVSKAQAKKQRNVAAAPLEVIKNWTAGDKARVTTALGILPASIMKTLAGLRMHRVDKPQSQHAGTGGKRITQADYEATEHILTIYDDAFKKDLNVFGEGTSGFSSALQQTVVHELGHAIDYTPFRRAGKKAEKLVAASNRLSGAAVAAVNAYHKKTYNAARQTTQKANNTAAGKLVALYNANRSSKSPELAKLGKVLGKSKGTPKRINFLDLDKPVEKKEFESRISTLKTFVVIKTSAVVKALEGVLSLYKVETETLAFHGMLDTWYRKGGSAPTIPAIVNQTPAKKAFAKVKMYRDSLAAIDAGEAARKKVRSESGYYEELKGTGAKAKWTRNKTEALKPGESNAFRTAAKKDFPTSAINRITDYADNKWADMYAESISLYFTDSARLKLLRPNVHQYFANKYKGN